MTPADILQKEPVPAAEALQAPYQQKALTALIGEPQVPVSPGYRTFGGPTSCMPLHGVNPFLATSQPGPVANEPFTMVFWTRALVVPEDTSMCWIVIGHQPFTPTDFSSWGMPGCWLLVSPDSFVQCPVGINDGFITRTPSHPGRVALRWTPTTADVGRKVWMQFLVSAPGENMFGLLASHAVELQVGHSNWRNQ
jgi:hypothetical protein